MSSQTYSKITKLMLWEQIKFISTYISKQRINGMVTIRICYRKWNHLETNANACFTKTMRLIIHIVADVTSYHAYLHVGTT